MQLAEERQMQMRGVRGEERMSEQQRSGAGGCRKQEPDADPAHRPDDEPRFGPARAARHVLQDHPGGEREPGEAAGQVVAAQQEVHREALSRGT